MLFVKNDKQARDCDCLSDGLESYALTVKMAHVCFVSKACGVRPETLIQSTNGCTAAFSACGFGVVVGGG